MKHLSTDYKQPGMTQSFLPMIEEQPMEEPFYLAYTSVRYVLPHTG